MDTRARAERIVLEYVKKAVNVGFLSVTEKTQTRLHVHLGSFPLSLSHKAPIELFDVNALKAVQTEMLKALFRRYGVEYAAAEGKEMIAALAGSTVERYARAVVKAIPIVGKLLWEESEAVLAGASTYALAQIAVLRLELEQTFKELKFLAAKQVYEAEFETGKEVAARLKNEGTATALVIDFETAKKRYQEACQHEKPVTPEEDPFAIYVDDAPKAAANEAGRKAAAAPERPAEGSDEHLARLIELKEKGFLTEDEFDKYKQKLLNSN